MKLQEATSSNKLSDDFSARELSLDELSQISGGIGFLGGAGAVLLACELYSWGYDYASSRLNKAKK